MKRTLTVSALLAAAAMTLPALAGPGIPMPRNTFRGNDAKPAAPAPARDGQAVSTDKRSDKPADPSKPADNTKPADPNAPADPSAPPKLGPDGKPLPPEAAQPPRDGDKAGAPAAPAANNAPAKPPTYRERRDDALRALYGTKKPLTPAGAAPSTRPAPPSTQGDRSAAPAGSK
jgi:hypothetical protein